MYEAEFDKYVSSQMKAALEIHETETLLAALKIAAKQESKLVAILPQIQERIEQGYLIVTWTSDYVTLRTKAQPIDDPVYVIINNSGGVKPWNLSS